MQLKCTFFSEDTYVMVIVIVAPNLGAKSLFYQKMNSYKRRTPKYLMKIAAFKRKYFGPIV